MEEKSTKDRFAKYLPLGTVVLLRGATKKIMITGYYSADVNKTDKVYDYSGCLYPEGFLSFDQTCLFDHNQIGKIYHLGYKDEEQEKFMNVLKETVAKLEESKKDMN